MREERAEHPLLKEVHSHLFEFEERIFGMTLTQLLCDVGAGIGILMLTAALPLLARIAVGSFLAIPALILVHGAVAGQSLVHWGYLYARFALLPRYTTWQSLDEVNAGKRRRGHPSPVQEAWIQLDSLEGNIMGYSEPGGKRKGPRGRYWMIFEVEGRNIRYLPEQEQVRVFGRFERFLVGLSFRLQFITHVKQVHPDSHPPLVAQKRLLAAIARLFPRIARLQETSIGYQRRHLSHCTATRYFVVVSVSAREEALRLASDGSRKSVLAVLWNLLISGGVPAVSRAYLLDQLRIRASLVKHLFGQLEIRAWPLADADLLQAFASCLALGAEVPSFQPELLGAAPPAAATEQHGVEEDVSPHAPRQETRAYAYRKRVRGLHATCAYASKSPQERFEAAAVRLADLLAPTSIDVLPGALAVRVGAQTRYQRYFAIKGDMLPHQLLCGWAGELSGLGLPMITTSQFDPIDSAFMIGRLEGQHLKLKSQRHADRKSERETRASQSVEEDHVRGALQLLAGRRTKAHAVCMLIGIHASSPERLEQRSRYLLSHLRQKQLRCRPTTRRHDESWQVSLPVCAQAPLDLASPMLSAEASTLLHCTSGVVGTADGPFVGFVGSGLGKQPVHWNPWLLSNPHMVAIGETGSGKSWLGKLITLGLLGQGIADVAVLDKDDDFLKLAEELQGECQRVVLARGCPINMFDIPVAPGDIDPQNPEDLFSEFLENSLLPALALVVSKAGTELSPIEEAYLMQVARATFAAQGITSEAVMSGPNTLLRPMPTLSDFIATMRQLPASSEAMKLSLLERLERATYLFSGQTSISIEKPLTIFSIHGLKEDWYPLATYVVQNFLLRHRALRRNERYLAYVVEEASYMLKHPAGRKYLESGSRGFRKLGIAQFTLSQNPVEFLEEGQVVLNNAGTVFYFGMPENAARKLNLSPELEHQVTTALPGQAVMRCGQEYAAITIASIPPLHALFTTHPQEQRELERREQHSRGPQHDTVQARAS